jgi:hypothetical protein
MMRVLVILTAVLLMGGLFASSEAAPPGTPTAATDSFDLSAGLGVTSQEALNRRAAQRLGIATPEAAIAQQRCCKICSIGKACGNTCISRDKQCHVGPGCACDG